MEIESILNRYLNSSAEKSSVIIFALQLVQFCLFYFTLILNVLLLCASEQPLRHSGLVSERERLLLRETMTSFQRLMIL